MANLIDPPEPNYDEDDLQEMREWEHTENEFGHCRNCGVSLETLQVRGELTNGTALGYCINCNTLQVRKPKQ